MEIDTGNKPEFSIINSTLMRINNILQEIKDISIKTELHPNNVNYLSKGRGQHMKLKLVKDLFIQSVAFLPTKEVDVLWNKINSLKPEYRTTSDYNNKYKVAHFNSEIEESLDLFLIEIQMKLQNKGFFDPTKKWGGVQ